MQVNPLANDPNQLLLSKDPDLFVATSIAQRGTTFRQERSYLGSSPSNFLALWASFSAMETREDKATKLCSSFGDGAAKLINNLGKTNPLHSKFRLEEFRFDTGLRNADRGNRWALQASELASFCDVPVCLHFRRCSMA